MIVDVPAHDDILEKPVFPHKVLEADDIRDHLDLGSVLEVQRGVHQEVLVMVAVDVVAFNPHVFQGVVVPTTDKKKKRIT